MGGKESKQFPITTDEALKRVTDAERRRLQDAFRRHSNSSGHISKQTFLRDVLGDSIPLTLAEQIYSLCVTGFGGHSSVSGSFSSKAYENSTNGVIAASSLGYSGGPSSSKGLSFKEVLATLVLITRGTHEEKIKFIYGLLACENGAYIEKDDAFRIITDWESGHVPDAISHSLFNENDKISFETFSSWIESHYECMAISRWLLIPNQSLSLVNKIDTPTFYQTLAGVTHLDEGEIVDLEKRFWVLAARNKDKSNRIDINSLKQLVSPPMPNKLTLAFFHALDENQDGHIDFKELCCGVSAACRGPDLERQKLCYKLLNTNQDGMINFGNVSEMEDDVVKSSSQCMDINSYIKYMKFNMTEFMYKSMALSDRSLQNSSDKRENSLKMPMEDFLLWAVDNPHSTHLLTLISLMAHIISGLAPRTKKEEKTIVEGWINYEKQCIQPGSVWYLLSMDWWIQWKNYVNDDNCNIHPNLSTSNYKTNKKGDSIYCDSRFEDLELIHDIRVSQSIEEPNIDEVNSFNYGNSHGSKEHSAYSGSEFCSIQKQQKLKRPLSHFDRPDFIDNSYLVNSKFNSTKLIDNFRRNDWDEIETYHAFKIVPKRIWDILEHWYGSFCPLPRKFFRSEHGHPELELRSISIKIFVHKANQEQSNIQIIPNISQNVTANSFKATNQNSSNYKFLYQSNFSPKATILEVESEIVTKLSMSRQELRLLQFQCEGKWKILSRSDAALEDEGFVDEDSILVEIRSKDGTWPEEINSLYKDRRASTLPQTTISAPAGMTGLNNLGNTCYMNAAIQCLSNTKILSAYFNRNCHLHEINRTNPLGRKGHFAKRFGDLIREMWAGNTRTVAPIKLRWTIGRYNSSFSNMQQQDSQEFLAFLLDGLHEDLNRVTTKKYVELKDSDGRPDIVVSQEADQNHSARNKSIVVDLFTGQLKSKVTCKVCGHESVKFDPFQYLSLPLPMESSVHIDVIVIRQNGSIPIKYGLTMDMEARYSDLKRSLSQLCQIETQNLILVDIVQSQFRVTQNEELKMKSLNGACLFAYEVYLILPTKNELEDPKSLPDIQRSIGNTTDWQKKIEEEPDLDSKKLQDLSLQNSGSNVSLTDAKKSEESPNDNGSSCEDSRKNMNFSSSIASKKRNQEGKEDALMPESKIGPANVPVNQVSETTSFRYTAKDANNQGQSDNVMNSKSDKKEKMVESKCSDALVKSENFLTSDASSDNVSKEIAGKLLEENSSIGNKSNFSHSRQSSDTCHTSSSSLCDNRNGDIGNCVQGSIVGLHRKMMPQETYFLSTEKYRPVLFGLPIVVSCSSTTTYQDLYKSVWIQVSRLVSPLPPKDKTQNHATDCDDSMGYEYPFLLKVVQKGGSRCAWCPWHRFCRGCALPCTSQDFAFAASYLAIDWDQTALHLRYLSAQEKAFQEDPSVEISLKAATEPITLSRCLEQFTKQEELGPDEKYYCSSCKSHQLASKKLQIWRLPPVLIVHLKRFHFLNGRWIKSHKIVDFPIKDFDPTNYLAAVPCNTLQRFKELVEMGKTSSAKVTKARNIWKNCNGAIDEHTESDVNEEVIDDEACAQFSNKIISDLQQHQSEKLPVSAETKLHQNGVIKPNSDSVQFEEIITNRATSGNLSKNAVENIFSPKSNRRMRQESTSLYTHPITDDDLQDFHQHKLLPGRHPLEIKYNLRSMVCHSGVMGGGHYVSYCKTAADKWWCQNDSTCKELDGDRIDKTSAYILFFEREGLNAEEYLPKVDTTAAKLELGDLDDELEMDFKKQCAVM